MRRAPCEMDFNSAKAGGKKIGTSGLSGTAPGSLRSPLLPTC